MKEPRKPSNPIKRPVIERLMNYFRPDPRDQQDDEMPTLYERPAGFVPPPRPFSPATPLPPREMRPSQPPPLVDPSAPPLYPLGKPEQRRPE